MTVPTAWFGSLPVGCSAFPLRPEFHTLTDEEKTSQLRGRGGYISDYLLSSDSCPAYQITVPDQPFFFPITAGRSLDYRGIVFFPLRQEIPASLSFHPQGFRLQGVLGPADLPASLLQDEPLPLLVFSHGYESEFMVHLTLLRLLASHGFMVAAVFHGDLRTGQDAIGTRDESSLVRRERLLLRGLSLQGLLDWMAASPFAGRYNPDLTGGVGISFGGASLMLLSGAPLQAEGYDPAVWRDPRLCCCAAQVPYMGSARFRLWSEEPAAWNEADLAWLGISGTEDTLAPLPQVRETLSRLPRDSYLVSMEREEHFMTARGIRVADTWVLKFMQAFLGRDRQARALFQPGSRVDSPVNNSLEVL